MVILIGGASHSGKTNLAQILMEKYKFPYLSLDHIKMGLIRGGRAEDFSATDEDEAISRKMWPVVEGIIRTNIENEQNIIIEGCYLPHKQVKELKAEFPKTIVELYICFSDDYVMDNFEKEIIKNRSVIEKRLYREESTAKEFVCQHKKILQACKKNNLKYYEIKENYLEQIKEIISFFDKYVLMKQ